MPFAASALVTYALCPTCTGGGGGGPVAPVNLNDLTDVTLTAPLNPGTTLVFNGVQWVNQRLLVNDLGDADTVTDPPLAGEALIWNGTNWVPQSAGGCQLLEVGGASGVLVVNDGLGTPNPVATGWTLQASGLHGIVTVAPAAGPVTVQIRLMPANTVLATGTIAIGANVATWTANAALAFADGQWIESVVTATDGTAAELTVIAEMCGPGGTSAATAVVEVGEGPTLPPNAAGGELWRLIGSAGPPDGLYYWTGTAWVQA